MADPLALALAQRRDPYATRIGLGGVRGDPIVGREDLPSPGPSWWDDVRDGMRERARRGPNAWLAEAVANTAHGGLSPGINPWFWASMGAAPGPTLGALGGLWKNRGVTAAEQTRDAASLPGDVLSGSIDPNSADGIRRAFDLAGLVTLGAGAIPARAAANELRAGARLATSQHFLDEARVAEKAAAGDYEVMVSPEFSVRGRPYQAVLDGNHSLAAARRNGVEPDLIEATPQVHDAVLRLRQGDVKGFLEAVDMNEGGWIDALSRRELAALNRLVQANMGGSPAASGIAGALMSAPQAPASSEASRDALIRALMSPEPVSQWGAVPQAAPPDRRQPDATFRRLQAMGLAT